MSTLSGTASKGEKTKSKFQSLDINSLYKHSRGENTEKPAQKSSSVYIKHGMQSLGKVPNARRAPANLPSLKSEHSGSDAAVPLVPPGATGWGKQQESASPGVANSSGGQVNGPSAVQNGSGPSPTVPSPNQPPQLTPHQQAIALPVTTTVPPHNKQAPPNAPPASTSGDKLWSTVMAGPPQDGQPPIYQSPQFQHEFPSLSAGEGGAAGAAPRPLPDALSLRPQTEGSWTQGGQRPGAPEGPGAAAAAGPRAASGGPLGAPPQLQGQAGRGAAGAEPFPPQIRGVMPPFMYKGSFPPGGAAAGSNQQQQQQQQQPPPSLNGRRPGDNRPPRLMERDAQPEDLAPRPIIREEELSKLDEYSGDMGWAASDDIDYNQKLAFSDDESDRQPKKESKMQAQHVKQQQQDSRSDRQTPPRHWNHPRSTNSRGRSSEEDEVWAQRQRQLEKQVGLAIQRAKQRKEEEEKRFNEEKQRATKKLQELDEKRRRESEVTAKPDNIPLPDFQKEKENRSRTPSSGTTKEENSFRQMTQIEGKSFPRKLQQKPEQVGPNFSRQFQHDLPPRFLKHQRSNSSAQAPYQYYDSNRWGANPQNSMSKPQTRRTDSPEEDKREYKRQGSDESYLGLHHAQQRDEPASKPQEEHQEKIDSGAEWRDFETEDAFCSWNDVIEAGYEEKKEKEKPKEEKRQIPALVPGPITKDRIEAEDIKGENRSLTQLKKGELKKQEVSKKDDKSTESLDKMPWAESILLSSETLDVKLLQETKEDVVKKEDVHSRHSRNNRSFSQSKSWGSSSSSSDYHTRGSWNKRQPSRGHKSGGVGRDFYGHGTDSDGSTDNHSFDSKDSRTMPRKPMEKDDKNRENRQEKAGGEQQKPEGYVPKGEPSRHGRGGGNFRGSRVGGLGKRIDGYGPPPSKSPFGHHEDKDKKLLTEDSATETNSSSDKTKMNQEALAAGIIGKNRQDFDDKTRPRSKPDNRRNKSKSRKEEQPQDMDSPDNRDRQKQPPLRSMSRGGQRGGPRGRNPPRMGGDKRPPYDSAPLKKADPQNVLANAIADISLKNKDEIEDKSDKNDLSGDSEGFQEVKSKKTSKERQKNSEEKKVPVKADNKDLRKPASVPVIAKTTQMTQQQIQNIPPLMSTPVNPPSVMAQSKTQFERANRNKLAPRFAKQKMQKQQQMQQHMLNDVNDIGKMPQNVGVYGLKETNPTVVPVNSCAWDKPLGSQLRTVDQESPSPGAMLGISMEAVKLDASPSPGHAPSPNDDKMAVKSDKALLDGATPPVNTIIFENTNFKSAPGSRARNGSGADKPRSKLDENSMDSNVFGKPMNDLLKGEGAAKPEHMQLPVFKEDGSDMKLDFFGSDLSHLTDDKTTTTKNLCMSKSITTVNSTICNTDSLNMKIASVKKVWDTSEQEADESGGISFGGPVLDPNVFKGNDAQDDSHEGYSPGPNQNSATTTNVCKVTGSTGQTVTTSQQQHSAIVAQAMLLGTPLSPPPMAAPPVLGAGVGLGPQQYTAAAAAAAASQHMGFQTAGHAPAAPAGSTQYGISTIPSPPTVLYNSTQQLQAAAAQSGLYGAFLPTADQASVLGGQGRSQFSQYPSYHNLGQAASSPYNTQSVYLQTAPHPPPTAPAPPELYTNMNSYRLSATAPFGQSQQLNNPTTVLISSTSNSLMSATVKQSNQQINAIGTKAGGVGQAYQQQSQQGQQVYMTYDQIPAAANYLSNASVLQRSHTAPVQNSVMPTLQPSSSFYSGSTGGQTGYFPQPSNSTLQSAAQLPQHQAGYGLQGNVFGTHGQSHTSTGLQGYNSHFLSTPMAMAAAISAPQYMKPNHYLKGVGSGQQMGNEQAVAAVASGRPQQLKSPGGQEALSSVFNSGFFAAPQIPSPKSRQNNKQSSPTSQRKYFCAGVYQQNNVQQRYPTPIQRPVNFQSQNMNSSQQNVNQKHKSNSSNKPPNRQYYGGQNNSLSSSQNDKADDSKVADSNPAKTVNSSPTEIVKDGIGKEEVAALKD